MGLSLLECGVLASVPPRATAIFLAIDKTTERSTIMATPDRASLADGLVSIGEDAIATSNDALLDDYYTDDYRLHSPAGDFNRFTDFRISRAQILVDGNLVSARTVMAGRFDKEFAYTPIGTVAPNGQRVQWELINIFRYTDEGRLVEEWVQTDTYDFLRQLDAFISEDARH
jgi:predicted ester cyclase